MTVFVIKRQDGKFWDGSTKTWIEMACSWKSSIRRDKEFMLHASKDDPTAVRRQMEWGESANKGSL